MRKILAFTLLGFGLLWWQDGLITAIISVVAVSLLVILVMPVIRPIFSMLKSAKNSQGQDQNKTARGQVIFFWTCWATVLSLLTTLFVVAGKRFDVPIVTSILLAVGITGLLLWKLSEFFFLFTPEATGIVTVNVVTGTYYDYVSPGLFFRYPWEKIHKQNFFSLKTLVTEVFVETFPTKQKKVEKVMKGGSVVKVKWLYQWRTLRIPGAVVKRLFIDNATISEGVKGIVSGKLAEEIAKKTDEEAREFMGEINKLVAEAVMAKPGSTKKKDGTDSNLLKDDYGIELVVMTILDIDFEERYQQARSSRAKKMHLNEMAAEFKTDYPGISDKDALNLAMVLNGDVPKTIVETEGEGGQALASLLIAMAQGGGSKGGSSK